MGSEIRNVEYDAVLDSYYHLGEEGQRIYVWIGDITEVKMNQSITQGDQDLYRKLFSNQPSKEDLKIYNDTFGTGSEVFDILKSPIQPKSPNSGLYQNTNYLEFVRAKKELYKKIEEGGNVVSLYKQRLRAILTEQNSIVAQMRQVASVQSNATLFTVIAATSQLLNIKVPGLGSAASSAIVTAGQIAENAKDNIRVQLLNEDLIYLERERLAIEDYLRKESPGINPMYYIIGGLVVVILFIIVRKRFIK
jgi:hypothetical protein